MAGHGRNRVEIGYVARAHGIRGEVRVVTHDPGSETLARVERIIVAERALTVARARPSGDAWLVSLAEIPDRSAAETLRGKPVEVDRAALELSDDDVLLSDLVDCEVELPSGEAWGKVAAIEQGPGQDRLVIHDGDVERLLPLVDAFLVDIDLDAARIVVDPPDGLPEVPIARARKPTP